MRSNLLFYLGVGIDGFALLTTLSNLFMMGIFNPISPISVVGFARSILRRIKSFQTQGTDSGKTPGKPNVRYLSEGRCGKVIYESTEATFALYYEFGGGDVIVCVDIPSPQKWEAATGLPLERRDEILNFIGQRVVKDQTRGRSFKIEGNWMNIYA